MTLIMCESLREIGEMACVTSAWSSRGQTLNTEDLFNSFLHDPPGSIKTQITFPVFLIPFNLYR